MRCRKSLKLLNFFLILHFHILRCMAGGWPAPTYEWFKEEYRNNTLISIKIDPLKNPKYTVSGGSLIIHEPTQKEDRGNYHCVASNMFGSIISESVSLSFGYIAEFILQRTTELANQFWGKAIYCDPPQYFPGICKYFIFPAAFALLTTPTHTCKCFCED